jgi:CubicO group peptidase (beta-lactamase class C family)
LRLLTRPDASSGPLDMRTQFRCITLFVLLCTIAPLQGADDPTPQIDLQKLDPHRILFENSYMTQPNSFYYFHNMDRLGFRLDWVRKPEQAFPLKEAAEPFQVSYTYRGVPYKLEDYYRRSSVLGVLVLHDDQIITETYFHGADAHSRFLSNSVAKSILSVLIGVAINEGKIESVEDPVEKYLPYLATSGYHGVKIKDALHMATGIKFDEDYLRPDADIHRLAAALIRGDESFQDLAASLRAKAKPDTRFEYQSINTEVLGLVLERVTGKPLNDYAEEKLWRKIGPESDAFFYRGVKQLNTCAFGCFNATLRDYARFGLMAMRGGQLGSEQVVPESWIRESTTPDAPYLQPKPNKKNDVTRIGYQYQWWIPYGHDRAFVAMGIYGQMIYVNPAKRVVIVQSSAWKEPDTDAQWDESLKCFEAIAAKVAQ